MHVNIVTSTKSGIGEILVASVLADHLNANGRKCLAMDLAATPSRFSHFASLNVLAAPIAPERPGEPSRTERERVARLANALAMLEGDEYPAAVAFCQGQYYYETIKHLTAKQTAQRITDAGNTLLIHPIVINGWCTEACLKSIDKLAQAFPAPARFVVWINQEFERYSRADFEQTPQFARHRERIAHIIEMPRVSYAPFRQSVHEMLNRGEAFSECVAKLEAIMPTLKDSAHTGAGPDLEEVMRLNGLNKVYQTLRPHLPPLDIVAR